ncbi:unnamed protein product [Psylliodes chrysocephalus]|uniref:Uncharacterized protein n=1 Tax=Psylliodes chrysocephalus TaxID=3402493 RepID=A0A9P0G5L3_9CUCU|nr:unnamed protein product [Psylliodes chrysocephala]
MEHNDADSAKESIVEDNYSDQKPQGQVSEEDSDLEDQPANEHSTTKPYIIGLTKLLPMDRHLFVSYLADYLEGQLLTQEAKRPIIIYSDGCMAQNRSSLLANALLYLSDKYDDSITQKFLEKDHTQMECDSVHNAIETCLKNK